MNHSKRLTLALTGLMGASLSPPASAQFLPIRELDSNGLVTSDGAAVVRHGNAVGSGNHGFWSGVRWDAGGSHLLPPLLGDDIAVALDFNDRQSVVGWSARIGGYESYTTAVLWKNDSPVNLGSLVTNGGPFGPLTSASGIDRFGRICGNGVVGRYALRGFLFESGVLTDLGSLGGSSIANRMNDHRQVAGLGGLTSGTSHAFLWDNGVLVDLHDPAQITGPSSNTHDIDRFGRICGDALFSDPVRGNRNSAVLFDRGTVIDLGVSSAGDSSALGMNDFGVVVGWRLDAAFVTHACLFQGGSVVDLEGLIDPALGWTLNRAADVDDEGRIVGNGILNGAPRAFIIEPPCAGFFGRYGSGCAGSSGLVPDLHGAGCPTPDRDFALELIDALASAPAFVCIGTGQGSVPVKPGCNLQVLPLLGILPFLTDGFGELWLSTRLPSGTPTFDLFAQVFLIDRSAPLGIAASNPLQVHFQ